MKKHMIIMAAALAVSMVTGVADGQETADSVKTENLEEVVVEGKTQYVAPQTAVYTPSKQQKSAAADAVDLLARMSIPQLKVNPVEGTVRTNNRQVVAIFIDGVPASDAEQKAMRAADVARVEYLLSPSDVRFQNKPYVVNFIMRRYSAGGYSRLNASESFFTGNTSAMAYGKTVFKQMVFDASLTENYRNVRTPGETEEAVYRLPSGEITRKSRSDFAKRENNNLRFQFRAVYHNGGKDKPMTRYISNAAGISGYDAPGNERSGTVSFFPSVTADGSFRSESEMHSLNADWNGYYWFALGRGWNMVLSPAFSYSKSRGRYMYSSDSMSEPVDNVSHESVYNGSFGINAGKTFGSVHYFGIGMHGSLNINDIDYSGSTCDNDRFRRTLVSVAPTYSFRTQRFSGSAVASLQYEGNRLDGVDTSDVCPSVQLRGSYVFSDRHSADASLIFGVNSNMSADKSDNELQTSELMWHKGNAGLKNARYVSAEASYSWMPSDRWSFSADASIFRIFDRPVPRFLPEGPGATMLRQVVNDGDFQYSSVGVSATANLLDGNLTFSAKPQVRLYHITGIYAEDKTNLACSFSIDYYLKSFYFSAFYDLPEAWSPVQLAPDFTRSKDASSYQIAAGWRDSHWNVRMVAANFFRGSWTGATEGVVSRHYDYVSRSVDIMRHRRITLSVSYTFGFGKKVSRGDEVRVSSGVESGILR